MRNLLYACILVILGIFLALGFDWAQKNFVPSPQSRHLPKEGRLRYPEIDYLRENALSRLSELPAHERQELRDSLRFSVSPLEPWLEKIAGTSLQLICVGERHDDVTRSFLAGRFFPRLPVDVLMLETTHEDLDILIRLIDSGSQRLSMLEADVAEIIRAARKTNDEVRVYGIEESRAQRIARYERGEGSREQSIVENFHARFDPRSRHAVLYGALHCLDEPQWFFGRVRSGKEQSRIGPAMSVNVISAVESGETEAFVNFLKALEMPPPPFVVPHPEMLHAEVYAWFPHLTQSFRQYDAVIVF